MTWMTHLDLLVPADYAALVLLLIGWIGIGWFIENAPSHRPSVSVLMARFRLEWMRQMVTRDPRIFDSQMIGHMRQGASFFASATMLAIGGGLALIGNTGPISKVARDLTQVDTPALIWELKLILVVLLISSAFLKYVWAHRLFGYAAVLMAAVPNDITDPHCEARAQQAGEINVLASRAFTRGMRTTYFALAACAWLLGPWTLMAAVISVVAMLWRREFASNSRVALMRDPPPEA